MSEDMSGEEWDGFTESITDVVMDNLCASTLSMENDHIIKLKQSDCRAYLVDNIETLKKQLLKKGACHIKISKKDDDIQISFRKRKDYKEFIVITKREKLALFCDI